MGNIGHKTQIDTGNMGHKTQKDRHGQHSALGTERLTRATFGTRHRKIGTTPPKKIDTGNIGQKRQNDGHR